MEVKVTKIKDGRIGKFVVGKWFNLHRDERFAKLQRAVLQPCDTPMTESCGWVS
jgi:hypothetical protein